jgi:hypothetical protein
LHNGSRAAPHCGKRLLARIFIPVPGKIDNGMPFRAKALDVGTFVFQTPLLKNLQVRILPGGLLNFTFCQAKVERCQMLARQVIGKICRSTTEDVLQVEHGSLYPALHRLERKGWLSAKWESAGKDLKREFKYYRLTPAGRKQLAAEESNWKQLAAAIASVMWPVEEN